MCELLITTAYPLHLLPHFHCLILLQLGLSAEVKNLHFSSDNFYLLAQDHFSKLVGLLWLDPVIQRIDYVRSWISYSILPEFSLIVNDFYLTNRLKAYYVLCSWMHVSACAQKSLRQGHNFLISNVHIVFNHRKRI